MSEKDKRDPVLLRPARDYRSVYLDGIEAAAVAVEHIILSPDSVPICPNIIHAKGLEGETKHEDPHDTF